MQWLFLVWLFGSPPPVSLTVEPRHPIAAFTTRHLFGDFFKATLTNSSTKPVRVVTSPGTVGAYAVRVDGRDIQPKRIHIQCDDGFEIEVKQLEPGASAPVRVLGLTKYEGSQGRTFRPPGPGRYEIVCEYSCGGESAYDNLIHGPVF